MFADDRRSTDEFVARTVDVDGPTIDEGRMSGALELLYDVVESLGDARSPGFFARFEGQAAAAGNTSSSFSRRKWPGIQDSGGGSHFRTMAISHRL